MERRKQLKNIFHKIQYFSSEIGSQNYFWGKRIEENGTVYWLVSDFEFTPTQDEKNVFFVAQKDTSYIKLNHIKLSKLFITLRKKKFILDNVQTPISFI